MIDGAYIPKIHNTSKFSIVGIHNVLEEEATLDDDSVLNVLYGFF